MTRYKRYATKKLLDEVRRRGRLRVMDLNDNIRAYVFELAEQGKLRVHRTDEGWFVEPIEVPA